MKLKSVVKVGRRELRNEKGVFIFYKVVKDWNMFFCDLALLTVPTFYNYLFYASKLDSRAILINVRDIDGLYGANYVDSMRELVNYRYTNGKSLVANELGFLERYR